MNLRSILWPFTDDPIPAPPISARAIPSGAIQEPPTWSDPVCVECGEPVRMEDTQIRRSDASGVIHWRCFEGEE